MSFDVLVFDGGVQRRVTASSLTDVNIVSGITTDLISAGGFATTGYVDSAVSGAMASAGLGSAAVSSIVSGMLEPYITSSGLDGILGGYATSGALEDLSSAVSLLPTSAAVSAIVSGMPSVDSSAVNGMASAVVSGMLPGYGYATSGVVSSVVSGIVPALMAPYNHNTIQAVYKELLSTGERVYQLSTLVPDIVFSDEVTNLSSLFFRIRSGNPLISGSIALELTSSGAVLSRFNVSAGSTDTGYTIPINPAANGYLLLHRNTSSATDTLKDGEAVAAYLKVLKGLQSI